MFLCLPFHAEVLWRSVLTIFTAPHPTSVSHSHSLCWLLGIIPCLYVWFAFHCNNLQHFSSTLNFLLEGKRTPPSPLPVALLPKHRHSSDIFSLWGEKKKKKKCTNFVRQGTVKDIMTMALPELAQNASAVELQSG